MNDEHRCFCELAPLYALGCLDEADRLWVEAQATESPELAAELAELEETAAAIAYAAPVVAPPPGLKGRLFQQLGVETCESDSIARLSAIPTANSNQLGQPDWMNRFSNSEAARLRGMKWRRHRVKGVTYALLHFNLFTREVVVLLRAEPGTRYPLHRHRGIEEIFMLAGDLVIGERTYAVGDYIRSEAKSVHVVESRTGCLCYIRTFGDQILRETSANNNHRYSE
jgi:anti-sigma factor ChrR (cupin superfamily)